MFLHLGEIYLTDFISNCETSLNNFDLVVPKVPPRFITVFDWCIEMEKPGEARVWREKREGLS